jgi:hypothetical protein
LFFFHPLIRPIERRMKLAQEIAADELAIAQQQHEPVSYGRLLVSVVSKLGSARLMPTMSVGTAGPIESLTRRLVAMKFLNRVSRRVVFASAALLGLVALLGIVPWRLVAAEPVVPTAPMAPRLPPTASKTTAPQYAATIKVSIGPKDRPKDVLCAPTLVYLVGREAYFQSGDQSRRIEVSVESDQAKKPVEHSVQVKLIEKPESKTPNILMAPRVTLVDGQDCIVKTAEANGDELEIAVAIAQFKPAK